MKAQLAVKTAGKMDFSSEASERRFSIIKERNPEPAEFVEDWARLMQKQMQKQDKGVTDSLLWQTYDMVNTCHEAGISLYQAKALLSMYWIYGNKIPIDRSA